MGRSRPAGHLSSVPAWLAWATLPLGSTLLVLCAGRLRATPGERPPAWGGLLLPAHGAALEVALAGTVAGLLLLCGGWLLACRAAATRRLPRRQVWLLFAATVVPLLAGPPLFSHDAFSYAAQGELAVRHLSPYVASPRALGFGPLLSAVDPVWRGSPAPYGPVAVGWAWFAALVTGGQVVATVVVLRLVALAAVVGALLLGPADLMGRRQPVWLPMLALNPVTLLYLVSAAHNDALIGCLVALAILAVRRGSVAGAGAAVAAASAVKWPVLVALPAVAAIGVASWRDLARRLAPAAAGFVAVWGVLALVPHAFGWVGAAGVPASVTTPWAPSTMLGYLLAGLPVPAQLDVSVAGGLATARVVGLLVAAGLLVWALTGRRRGTIAAVAWSLMAVALAAPVVYPWYLAWGLFALPTSSWWRRDWLAPLLVVVSFSPVSSLPTAAVVALDVAAAVAWLAARALRVRAVPAPTVRGPWHEPVEAAPARRVAG